MLDQAWVKAIKSWVAPEDIGAINQWLDALKQLDPIAREHGLSNFQVYMIFFQAQQLNKIAQVRDLLQEIVDNDVGRGDSPRA